MAGVTSSLGSWSQQFSNEVHSRVLAQMRQKGQSVVTEAVFLAPRGKTGDLANSISYTINETDYDLEFHVGVPYGVFVEYGTRYMRPQPYLRPAINKVFGIYGFTTSMNFSAYQIKSRPILAHGRGFILPSNLTAQQLRHVRTHLKPASRAQWDHRSGNVQRTKLRVRTIDRR